MKTVKVRLSKETEDGGRGCSKSGRCNVAAFLTVGKRVGARLGPLIECDRFGCVG